MKLLINVHFTLSLFYSITLCLLCLVKLGIMGEPKNVNVFANIDDTNVIVPPRVDVTAFKVDHNLYVMLKAEGFFQNSINDDP